MALKLIKRSKEKPPRRISNIDAANGFMVSGWVFDPEDPSYTPVVEVLCADKVIGEGKADRYRPDLEDAGFGDGHHGFSIRLGMVASETTESLVTLRDRDTGQDLGANEYTIGGHQAADVVINRVDATGISGVVVARNSPITEADTVCIYIDGNVACSDNCIQINDGSEHKFHIALPVEVFDGMPHVFHADVAGKSVFSVPHMDILPAIQTTWDLIQSSSHHSGYASLSRIAAYRYESLRLGLGHVDSADGLQNLQLAHDIVVEGHCRRKNYESLSIPTHECPKVSIVVPVHNKFELTYHCIASCILAFNKASWELIVVDDASSDDTSQLAELVDSVVVVTNTTNKGFVRSCNEGASVAKGEYIVFLNNDTEVTSGWLDELLDQFNRFDGVGAVGSKLIYPDGRLQDAGGLVWDNGLPWNVGHGANASDPAYNYSRDVDYLTGASLMVHQEAWSEVGGFSEEYAPAYYEDTDFAFKLRASGYRTIYSPFSTVIHYEGQSNGRDISTGVKRYQEINAHRFVKKWSDEFTGNGIEGCGVEVHKDRNRKFRVLMIDHAFPCEGLDAGSYAAIQEMKLMMELGCKITFVPHNFTHLGKYTDELQRMGVECIYAPFYTSVNIFLERRGKEFDAVYITRYDVAERVIPDIREFTNSKIIFNNADLHFLREMRAAVARGDSDLRSARKTRDKELSVMSKVDAVLSYNETEHMIISSHTMRSDNIFKCPWVLENRRSPVEFSDRADIAFLGGFGHPPNREAIEFFVREVMPLLRSRIPGLVFRIYGSNFPEDLEYLQSDDVVLEGFVESLDTIFDTCRVFVAPLLSGAGIKGKVLDSMAYGVPAVLSPIAAEATGLIDGQSTLIAANPEAWVEAIATLYTDPVLWQRVRDASLAVVENRYSLNVGLEQMRTILDYVGLQDSQSTDSTFTASEIAANA